MLFKAHIPLKEFLSESRSRFNGEMPRISAIVGSEGGFSDEEIEMFIGFLVRIQENLKSCEPLDSGDTN